MRSLHLILFLFVIIFVDGCEIKIGVSVSETGPNRLFGLDVKRGIDFWWQYVNKTAISFPSLNTTCNVSVLYANDNSNPITLQQSYQNWLANGVRLFLGPYGTEMTTAAQQILNGTDAVMITGLTALDSRHVSQVFSTLPLPNEFVYPMLDIIDIHQCESISFVVENDEFQELLYDAFFLETSFRTIQVLGTYRVNSFDLYAVNEIASELSKENPSFIAVFASVYTSVNLVQSLKAINYLPEALYLSAGQYDQLSETLGEDLSYTLTSTQWDSSVNTPDKYFGNTSTVIEEFGQQFGVLMSVTSAGALSSCIALQAAIEYAESPNATEVLIALPQMDTVLSFWGKIRFDRNGVNIGAQVEGAQYLRRWNDLNPSRMVFSGPGASPGLPIYPMPKWNHKFDDTLTVNLVIGFGAFFFLTIFTGLISCAVRKANKVKKSRKSTPIALCDIVLSEPKIIGNTLVFLIHMQALFGATLLDLAIILFLSRVNCGDVGIMSSLGSSLIIGYYIFRLLNSFRILSRHDFFLVKLVNRYNLKKELEPLLYSCCVVFLVVLVILIDLSLIFSFTDGRPRDFQTIFVSRGLYRPDLAFPACGSVDPSKQHIYNQFVASQLIYKGILVTGLFIAYINLNKLHQRKHNLLTSIVVLFLVFIVCLIAILCFNYIHIYAVQESSQIIASLAVITASFTVTYASSPLKVRTKFWKFVKGHKILQGANLELAEFLAVKYQKDESDIQYKGNSSNSDKDFFVAKKAEFNKNNVRIKEFRNSVPVEMSKELFCNLRISEAHVENLLQFKGYIATKEGHLKGMILPDMECTLFDCLKSNTQWVETNKITILTAVASGLRYLHLLDIVHGDLRPTNILINGINTGELEIRLAEFGCSQEELHTRMIGDEDTSSIWYTAPEIFNSRKPDATSDMYSFGVVTYQVGGLLASAKELKRDISLLDSKIKHPLLQRLSKMCIVKDFSDRPTAEEAEQILASSESNSNEETPLLGHGDNNNLIQKRKPGKEENEM